VLRYVRRRFNQQYDDGVALGRWFSPDGHLSPSPPLFHAVQTGTLRRVAEFLVSYKATVRRLCTSCRLMFRVSDDLPDLP
jgi:hypothetical protein